MSLRLGDRISDYEVVGLLGSGGMGAVYQVRHLISDRTEAMKVLLPDFESDPHLADRFIREIRLQASLSHPNIASLHNALRVQNQLLMVMEYVDGRTLAEIIRSGPLNQLQAVQMATQVLAALEYAHSRGIIHRDVKPSNIMITAEGIAKLMDFGIARGVAEHGHLTQAGAAIGSLYYMSPEQLAAGNVDSRSDLYATGVTLFEALTGERPFKGNTAAELLEAQIKSRPADPSVLNSRVSRELSRIILKALEKNPGERYESAADFRDEIIGALQVVAAKQLAATEPDLRGISTKIRTPPVGTMTPTPNATPQPVSFDPVGLERVRKELAKHIGPMAKVLVDRAAKRSRTWQDLYSQLATEIPAGKDRDRFLTSYPRN